MRSGRPLLLTLVAVLVAGCIAPAVAPEGAAGGGSAGAAGGRGGVGGLWAEPVSGAADGVVGLASSATQPVTVHRAGAFVDEDPEELLGAFPVVVERLVGRRGAEPTIGVTSTGAAFVVAGDLAMRSRDGGVTWERTYDFGEAYAYGNAVVSNFDPMLWVDPATDRVFMPSMWPVLTCSEVVISDDEGETWFEKPLGCGLPVVDHQKLATGPWAATFRDLPQVYPSAVYYCYNKLVSTNCAVSHDGGVTFQREAVALRGCGGINGHPAAAPDGTVYVPAGLNCNIPAVAVSTDNGLTWTTRYIELGANRGQEEIDPEVTVTPDGTAYYMWRARADHRMYVVRSTDAFLTYDGPFLVSPPDVTSTNFAGMTSGDDGRVAFAYLGTRDTDVNAGQAPETTRWHMFVTFSFDAAAEEPTFVTTQVTPHEDPVQIGYIWQGGGSNPGRNMLDFIDMTRGPDGRAWVAFTDGCAACEDQAGSRSRDAAVAVLASGPSLLAARTPLDDTYGARVKLP